MVRYQWEDIFLAFKRYRDLHVHPPNFGRWTITQRFTVPQNSVEWPPQTWGMKLGLTACSIRNKHYYKDNRADLDTIGFDYSTVRKYAYCWEDILTAFQHYKAMKIPLEDHNKWTLPQRFVVPMDDPEWPPNTWGMKLGWTASSIRHTQAYKDHKPELESIGFDFAVGSRKPDKM